MSYAVLIPTKTRPRELRRLITACPSLNCDSTYVAIEPGEWTMYEAWRTSYPNIQTIQVENPHGVPGPVRDALRKVAVADGYDRYVMADDDETFTPTVLVAMVNGHRAWSETHGPCFVSGLHSVQKLFLKDEITYHTQTVGGYRFVQCVSFNFWCLPHAFMKDYQFPPTCLEDSHAALAAMRMGITNFLVCLDAPYNQERWQEGGMGSTHARVEKIGLAIAQMARDYPELMSRQFVSVKFPFSAALMAAKRRRTHSLKK